MRARAQQSPEAQRNAADAIARAEQAKAICENPVFVSALDDLERLYVDTWLGTEPDDTAGRERLHMAVRVTQEFRRHLRTMIDNGRMGREHLINLREGR